MNEWRASGPIVLTGVSGFLGSWLAEAVTSRWPSCQVVGLARHRGSAAAINAPNFTFVSGDLLDPQVICRLPGQASVVIHLAADRRPRVEPSVRRQQVLANVVGTSVIADYAEAAKAQGLIYASSSAIYSGLTRVPFAEDDVRLPIEHLGATKFAAEALLSARANEGAFRAVSLRLFTTYGPRSAMDQFIPGAIAKLSSPEPVARFVNPDVERDFIFVEDVVAAFFASLEHLPKAGVSYEVFNIGSGERTTVRRVIELLRLLVNPDKAVSFMPSSVTVTDTRHQADIRRAAEQLGWHPAIGLEEGLRRTVEAVQPVAAGPVS